MSFMRAGNKNVPRRKKPAPRKKAWDDTIGDLDAYKATPEEIAYRRAAHRSKHAVSAHLNRPGSARKGKRASPFRNNSQTRKIAIMKEVLYDQRQLQDVLEKSDTMMAVVKDLFGDDPRRFEGFPSVTTAPNLQDVDVASSLVRLPPNIRTRSEDISDSMMNASALNDLQDSDSELDDSHPAPLNYQPKMNLQRFHQFIEAEEKNHTLSTISGQAGMSHLGQAFTSHLQGAVQSSHLPDQTNLLSKDGTFQTPPKTRKDPNESLEMLQPPKSAMNDTNKINKTKRRVPKPEPSQNTSNLSLNELRKVLETLEDEIDDYEQKTGRRPPAERHRQESFSGYTLAIVDSVTKLTRYLRECDLQLKAEMIIREQLTQDVVQFRALVDALTSDIILTQEEFHKMSGEFQRFRVQTQDEIQRLKGEESRGQASPAQSLNSHPEEPILTETPPRNHTYQPDMATLQAKEANLPRELNPFGDHLKPVSAAVMLSPPVRRSRVMEPERDKQQQASLLDMGEYVSNVEGNNSAATDTFAELPETCTTSLASVYTQYGSQPIQQTADNKNTNVPQSRAPASIPVNSVNVPRPTPLVQSNVGMAFPTTQNSVQNTQTAQQLPQSYFQKHQPISIVPQDKPQTLQRSHEPATAMSQSQHSERSHDSGGSGPDREFLASQIAELNKQHAEAQKRLQTLRIQQGMSDNQQHIQQQQVQAQYQQQQQQQQRQQVVDNQQRLQQQQHQYEQQQKLLEMVMQQQQKIQHQQMLKQQQQQQQQQGGGQHDSARPDIPRETGDAVRVSAEYPGYRPQRKQTGLPAYPVSPNISPISQRSESYRNMYQSANSQHENGMAGAGRGITVSIPMVDMDQSLTSLSPNPQTAR